MSSMIKEITITPILASFCVVVTSIDIKFFCDLDAKPQIFWLDFTHFKMSFIILDIYLWLSIKEFCMDCISSFTFCISFIEFSMISKRTSISIAKPCPLLSMLQFIVSTPYNPTHNSRINPSMEAHCNQHEWLAWNLNKISFDKKNSMKTKLFILN